MDKLNTYKVFSKPGVALMIWLLLSLVGVIIVIACIIAAFKNVLEIEGKKKRGFLAITEILSTYLVNYL